MHKSIAPPIPLIILPGTIQFARSPLSNTCNAPNKVRSRYLPRMMHCK